MTSACLRPSGCSSSATQSRAGTTQGSKTASGRSRPGSACLQGDGRAPPHELDRARTGVVLERAPHARDARGRRADGQARDRVRAVLGDHRRSRRPPPPSARRRRLGDAHRPQPGAPDARTATRSTRPRAGRHSRRGRAEVPDWCARDADVRVRLERAGAWERSFGRLPDPEGAQREVRSRRRSSRAPPLDSGSLRLPHFGDCTHDGQPDLQRHSPINRFASPTSRSNSS